MRIQNRLKSFKKFLMPCFLLLISIFYLVWSYGYPYNFQKDNFIPKPNYPVQELLTGTEKGVPLKLVVLGDSLFSGTGSTDSTKSLGYLIAKSLVKKPGPDVLLVNLSAPGKGVEDVLARQVPLTVREKPDYIVLFIGVNDVHNLVLDGYFQYVYGKVLDELKATKAKVTLVNIPYLGSNKIFFTPWNIIMGWRTERLNVIINKLSKVRGLQTIDLYGEFKAKFENNSNLYAIDQFHPSDAGYALWAGYINANLNR